MFNYIPMQLSFVMRWILSAFLFYTTFTVILGCAKIHNINPHKLVSWIRRCKVITFYEYYVRDVAKNGSVATVSQNEVTVYTFARNWPIADDFFLSNFTLLAVNL